MSPKKNLTAAAKRKAASNTKVAKPDQMRTMMGQQLKMAREARGLSQVQAATAMGWGKDRLCRIENGTRSLNALHKGQLCQLYGISEAQLEGLREGDTKISGRYLSLPVVDRHQVAKRGNSYTLPTVAKQTLCLDWLADHVSDKALHIVEGIRDDEDNAGTDAEFVVVDCSTTKVAQRGVYLLWSFSGSATLNRCEPDIATGKINVRTGGKNPPVAVAPDRIEVIGKVVGAWRRY